MDPGQAETVAARPDISVEYGGYGLICPIAAIINTVATAIPLLATIADANANAVVAILMIEKSSNSI